jgi:hypothetical protein
VQPCGSDAAVYGHNNGVGNTLNDLRLNSYDNGLASTGSTALYHHHGTRYGLGIGGCVASGGKMNGLHELKHRRGLSIENVGLRNSITGRIVLTFG